MSFSNEQVKELLKPIDPSRVGRDGKGFSHVEAWDIRKRMNQIFGIGEWSSEVEKMELIYETEVSGSKTRWSVAYRALCVVTVDGAVYSEWAGGDATNYPSRADAHDQAMKTAESQAFKRACVNLGDQFGLSLYKNGSIEATVQDVVEHTFEDSENVETWLAAMEAAESVDQLAVVTDQIKGADISAAGRNTLLDAYKVSAERVKTPVEAG